VDEAPIFGRRVEPHVRHQEAGGRAGLDFDGDKSVHMTGNGKYNMMSPVIGVVSVQ
jgi:hypothetical protein